MWTRAELKQRAKVALSNGYWRLVLVGLIASCVAGGGSSNGLDSEESLSSEFINELLAISPLVIGIATFTILVAIAISVFLFHPIEVGTKRFFLKSLTTKTQIREVGFAFDTGYLNVVKIMFIKNLKIILWGLLLFIPGIIKSYEYRMIPYLLAENPHMAEEDAFQLSRQMMSEQKWDTFILDLSFFGWELLSACTLGIVGIFYVQPYTHLTDAALYDTLSAVHGHPARSAHQWKNTTTYTGYEEM